MVFRFCAAENDHVRKMPNVIRQKGSVCRSDRNRLNMHRNGLVLFTGLSASGKSTIAHTVEKELFDRAIRAYVLDGDNLRHGLNADLGFSVEDRRENIRRVAEVSRLMVDAGLIVLAAFVSPFRTDRAFVRALFGDHEFAEVYVRCSLEECEKRDPKGFYAKARAGLISNYTGVSAPYEEPEEPDLVLDTEILDVGESAKIVLDFLIKKCLI